MQRVVLIPCGRNSGKLLGLLALLLLCSCDSDADPETADMSSHDESPVLTGKRVAGAERAALQAAQESVSRHRNLVGLVQKAAEMGAAHAAKKQEHFFTEAVKRARTQSSRLPSRRPPLH